MNADRHPRASRFPRPEGLLPLACIASAIAVFASEFMTTFQLTPPGGEALCNVQATGRHHFALGVLAVLAVVAVIVAVLTPSKPAAIAVGVSGGLALLLFLIIDLPDANNVGTLGGCSPTTNGSFFDAKAVPQAGFWLEMVGALALALSGAALATLSSEQLAAMRPKWLGRGKGGPKDQPAKAVEMGPASETEPNQDAPREPSLARTQEGRRREGS